MNDFSLSYNVPVAVHFPIALLGLSVHDAFVLLPIIYIRKLRNAASLSISLAAPCSPHLYRKYSANVVTQLTLYTQQYMTSGMGNE